MNLEVVTHCWRYSRLLTYQLSSFLARAADPSAPQLTATVFFCLEDKATVKVVEFFDALPLPNNVKWNWRPLPHAELANRAIGRNLAALATKADLVWFADADYCVLSDFWRALILSRYPSESPSFLNLFYPRTVKGTTHEEGLAAITAAAGQIRLLEPPAGTIEQTFRKAIGGVQFVPGDVCRANGYLNGKAKYLRPYTDGNWRPDVEDAQFRRSLGTPGMALHLPWLLRIRHGIRGGPDKIVNF